MPEVVRSHRLEDLVGIRAGLVLADPAFAYKTWSAKGETGRTPQRKYRRSMSVAEIAALPLPDIAGRNCWIACWIPNPHADEISQLAKGWHARFVGAGLCWLKINADGTIWNGIGHTTRHNTENCWLFRIGRPKRFSRRVSEVIIARRGRHSAKPFAQYSRLEALAGPCVFAELFARDAGPPAHWSAAGDELDLTATPSIITDTVAPTYDAVSSTWNPAP
jgi:N6-adenosine-specific RNA methylase IME4